MPLRIGDARDDRRRASRARATDYSQRQVRWRLFTWLALLMLVLALAERASDPRTWRWLQTWSSPVAPASQEAAPPPAPGSGSLTAQGQAIPTDAPSVSTTAGATTAGKPEATASSRPDAAPAAPDAQAIQRLWAQLAEPQRKQLAELVLAGAQQRPLATPIVAEAVAWLGRLAPEDAPPEAPLVALRSALQAVAACQELTPSQIRLLRAVQSGLRQVLLSEVEDGTAIFRPAERDVWLYVMAECRELGPQALHRVSRGRVAYVQLHQQPEVYRGHVVTVVGRVRRAYRVAALSNPLGLDEYAVYWVLPEGGPDVPVVVYALGVPRGFPALPLWDQQPGGAVLDESVEISGVFLKQAAYRGEGGVFTAPLLLTHTPRWQPRPPAPPPRGTGAVVVALMAAALVSLALVVGVWQRTRRRPGPARDGPESVQLPSDLNVTPKLEVALHELEQSAEESQP
jgi:hypothetical protein